MLEILKPDNKEIPLNTYEDIYEKVIKEIEDEGSLTEFLYFSLVSKIENEEDIDNIKRLKLELGKVFSRNFYNKISSNQKKRVDDISEMLRSKLDKSAA